MGCAYGRLGGGVVDLAPIELDLEWTGTAAQLSVRGCPSTTPYGALLQQAAQRHFGLPYWDSRRGRYLSDGDEIAQDQIPAIIRRKSFGAYIDGRSGLLRFHYRELVVQFHQDVSPATQLTFLRQRDLAIVRQSVQQPGQYIVKYPDRRWQGTDLVDTALRLCANSHIAFATPNFVSEYRRCGSGDEAFPAAQWHLEAIGIEEAWTVSRGKGATIAIIDDGVDTKHPAFDKRILSDPSPQARNPDPQAVGQRQREGEPEPNDYHGTACAGIAAANFDGVCMGVAPESQILPVKVFNGLELAPDAELSEAIVRAAKHARVLSCSWSATGTHIEQSLRTAAELGAIIVCAAGNDGGTIPEGVLPATAPEGLVIGASTRRGRVFNASNRGPQVRVFAPVSDDRHALARALLTTDYSQPGLGFNPGEAKLGGTDGLLYNGFSSTSAATAMVAGVVALMVAVDPKLDAQRIAAALFDTGLMLSDGSGGRQVHAGRALTAVAAGMA